MFESRAFGNSGDLRLMQEVVAASWRVEKPLVRFHVGDLAWAYHQHSGREGEWRIRLWADRDGEPGGWAWLRLPNDAELHVRPELRAELIPEIAAWLAGEATVTSAWPYRRELDWVVEAPDGGFVSSCLIWLDEENGVGELEPVGTDPAFWRRGFAFAVCAAGLRALREHGADTAIVYSTDVPGKPSAPALYRALGFETRARQLMFTPSRPLSGPPRRRP